MCSVLEKGHCGGYHLDHCMWSRWDRLVLFEHELDVLITVVIFLVVWGRFLPVIVLIAGCHGFAELGMLMHGIFTCGEIVQTVGTNEAQVVMHSLQMVYHNPFVLTFLPLPRAEG